MRISVFITLCMACTFQVNTLFAAEDDASQLFKQNCAVCHNGTDPRAPTQQALGYMTPGNVYKALTMGVMQDMAKSLSDSNRRQLAEYLTGRKISEAVAASPKRQCKTKKGWFDYQRSPAISGWGLSNAQNTRFIPAETAKLSVADVKKLKLKWVFSFPNAVETHSQPAVAGGAIFVGSQNGSLYALDAQSGCLHWVFQAEGGIQTAITISDWQEGTSTTTPVLYFSDATVRAYAVNAITGELLWKTKIDNHPHARMGGSVTLHRSKTGDRLYVPVSSFAAGSSKAPNTSCCNHRGSVSALDADTGKIFWTSYVIPTKPTEQYKNSLGIPQFGPAGAGVWSSPAIDEKRGRLYVGTGENSSTPTENGGAVVAINLSDGTIAWSYQMYPGESYNAACYGDGPNCPPSYKGRTGLDTSSPILLYGKDGKDIIVAGNKTGDVFGINPDTGKIQWRRRTTRGDFNWNNLHGMAVEGSTLFAAVQDALVNALSGPYWGDDELGVYAMDILTGKPLWRAPVTAHCSVARCRGYKAAATAIPGILFVGATDGYARALDSKTGALLWEAATNKEYQSLSGDTAHGGGINPAAPVVANGMVYISSGDIRSGTPGNVLLGYSVNGK